MALQRIGYPCVSLLLDRTTNHTCTLKNATPERLRALIRRNLDDLLAILRHNSEHGWLLFRIGSSVIPFGSHPINTIPWWREFKRELQETGALICRESMRVSFHPGQYTVLNSPDAGIVARAVKEIVYSARFLSELGLDFEHKIVLHIGGTYGDKAAAVERFCAAMLEIEPDVRRRIVIENDEHSYTPADVLAIAQQTNLPVVFDNLHYLANPGEGALEELIPAVFRTWREMDGRPKVHFSAQAIGRRRGHHADGVDPAEFRTWIERWSLFGDFDLMLEAKHKDRALLELERTR